MGQVIKSLVSICRHFHSRNFAILVRFWWNFARSFGARKVRTISLVVNIWWFPPLFCPIFTLSAFSIGKFKLCGKEAHVEIVVVNSSNGISRELLYTQTQYAVTINFVPKQKMGIMHFQWEYVCLKLTLQWSRFHFCVNVMCMFRNVRANVYSVNM